MKISKRVRNLYYKLFEAPAIKAENIGVIFLKRKQLRKLIKGMPRLTSKQKKAVRAYWKPYCKVKMNWFRYFTFMTGKFDPRYIPEDIMQTKIDQHFNSRKLSYGFNDKNNYSLIFSKFKQPKTLVRKIDSLLFDENYELLTSKKAMDIILKNDEVIVKPSQDTGGGKNIKFYNTKTDKKALDNLLNGKEQNFVVQQIIKQHPEMGKMHPESLNTVRVTTMLLEDGVHILSAVMRMGAGTSRVDNVSAKSSILAPINEDGTIMPNAISSSDFHSGNRLKTHPDGMPLSQIKIPNFECMLETAKKVSLYTGHFRFVGVDLCVDENENIVLIEVNMRKIDTMYTQALMGPFFGDLTEKILDEVFRKETK
ncbi:MAG: hypothetical protein MJ225_01955 [Bacilli bacterium]|nr:hypothetical protein [Bacilli bacterium]